MDKEELFAMAQAMDTEEYCTLESDTSRVVVVPDRYKTFGVEEDTNVERVKFKFPKIVGDNVDLTTLNLRVNFQNAIGGLDKYLVDDVKDNGDGYITFSWLIQDGVTREKGIIRFIVQALKVASDGTKEEKWSTTVSEFSQVLEGLEVDETIARQNPDIIEALLRRMDDVEKLATPEAMQGYVDDYLTRNPASGATEEEKQQLEQNTQDITDLKSALPDKVDKDGYKQITKNNAAFYKTGINKFNGVWHIGYMNTNGVIDESNTRYQHTDKIYLDGNNSILLSALGSNGINRTGRRARFVTAFDENGNVLADYGQQNVGANITPITINSAVVKSVVITLSASSTYDEFMIELSESTSGKYYPYSERIPKSDIELEENSLIGKTLLSFGDSIMAGDGNNGKGIADYISEKYGMTLHDYSLGGATIGATGSNNIFTQITSALSEVDTADIILFDGGTNDIVNVGGDTTINTDPKVPIGDLVDSIDSVATLADTTTFSGAMEYGIARLLEKYPNAIIIYIRAHQMGSRNQNLQISYGERAIEICERWGIDYVDLYKTFQSRYPTVMRTEFLTDYTHPNDNGYRKKYLPKIDAKLKTCVW